MAQTREVFDEITQYRTSNRSMRARAAIILDDVGVALVEKRKSASLGNNLRLESEKFMGAWLEFGDQIIQFREREWFRSLGRDETSFGQKGIPKQMNSSSCSDLGVAEARDVSIRGSYPF